MSSAEPDLQERIAPSRLKLEQSKSKTRPGQPGWEGQVLVVLEATVEIMGAVREHLESHPSPGDYSIKKVTATLGYVRESLGKAILQHRHADGGALWQRLCTDLEKVISEELPSLTAQVNDYRALKETAGLMDYIKRGGISRQAQDQATIRSEMAKIRAETWQLHSKLNMIREGWRIAIR